MINLKGVTFQYPGAQHPTLRNVSLDIKRGEFVALCGANGSGKTTLCKLFAGLIPSFIQGELSGEISFDGSQSLDLAESARHVGMVYQDFENQIVCPNVLDDVAFSCENFALDRPHERALNTLNRLGIAHLSKRAIWQLSGGEKHLVALAGALAHDADLLIIDEPAAQLDSTHAERIYDILSKLNTSGKTIVVCEHSTDYIQKHCDRVILLDDGRIYADGSPSHVFCGTLPAGFEATPLPGKTTDASIETPLPSKSVKAQKPLVRLCKLSAGYQGTAVLDCLSLDIRRGEKTVILGANGAGKSTLLDVLSGNLRPFDGEIWLDDNLVTNHKKLGDEIALVLQNPERMFITDSIRSDIEYGFKARQMADYASRADEIIRLFSLADFAQRDGRLVSGGQARRAAIAIGASLSPSILLLDEPTASLDSAAVRDIFLALDTLSSLIETVVIATHDLALARSWAERVVAIKDGKAAAL